MKISATITPESYTLYQVQLTKRVLNRGTNYGAIAVGLYSGAAVVVSGVYFGDVLPGLGMVAYALVFYFLLVWMGRFKLRSWMSQMGRCMYGEWTFECAQDGMVISGELFDKKFKYEAFVDIYRDSNCIFLMVGPMSGFHIPINDGNRDVADGFMKLAKERCRLG